MQGPRLYRFFNYEMPVYLPAPVGGWNPDANPWELPLDQASQLDNFLIRPGKVVNRGPLVISADLSTWAPVNLAGAAVTNTGQLLGRKSTAGGQIDPWNAPLLANAAASLATGLTTALWVVGSSPIAVAGLTADQIPGPRSINFYGQIYGLSYDSAGAVVQDANATYYMKPVSLYSLSKAPPVSPTGSPATFATDTGGAGNTAWTITATPHISVQTPNLAKGLDCTGLGFALPAGASVQGIQLTVTFTVNIPDSEGFGTSSAFDAQTIKGGVVGGSTRSAGSSSQNGPGTATYTFTLGGSTDLWGRTWAYTDINAANFGLALFGIAPQGQTAAWTTTVTAVSAKVWYTTANPAITAQTAAPHGAFDLIGYQERIWLLGGIDTPGAGTTHDPHALFFTNPISAGGGGVSTDWKDPVSNLTNKLVMDGDTADYGVGLATVRNGLIVLRRSSVYLLKGSTTANYALIPISREVGCVDARSIVETDDGVYFMSTQGLMFTNGTRVINVSGALTQTLQLAVQTEQHAVLQGGSGYVTCQRTSRGQILVSLGVSASGGSYTPILTVMYDPAAAKGGAWVRITSSLWSADGTQSGSNLYAGQVFAYGVPKRLITIGDKYITTFEDQLSSQTFLDPLSGIYDQDASAGFHAIPLTWRTPVPAITAANKRVIAIAKRYYLDYNFGASGLVPTTGWTIVPVDVTAAQLDTPQNVPVGAAPSGSWVGNTAALTSAFILRYNRDWASEIVDVTLEASWADAVVRAAQASPSVVEIYGVGLEFQRSRELRNTP